MMSDRSARLFVSDLDGTLLDGDAQLCDYSRSELTRLLDVGLMPSGRPLTKSSARTRVTAWCAT
jgi:hydroxymethylpyrimidine pyrophosphatase-like HAD family hydrolase